MLEDVFNGVLAYEALVSKYSSHLTRDEAYEIIIQFKRQHLFPGRQVMWSGIPRFWVQVEADKRGLQTLTSAMGPLMDVRSPVCRRKDKSQDEWSSYVAGASALFAECLPKGHGIILVTRPPPQRLHPLESTTYQLLEQPVLKGDLGGLAVSRINVVHITVRGAENSLYQLWPVDEGLLWSKTNASRTIRKHLRMRFARQSPSCDNANRLQGMRSKHRVGLKSLLYLRWRSKIGLSA